MLLPSAKEWSIARHPDGYCRSFGRCRQCRRGDGYVVANTCATSGKIIGYAYASKWKGRCAYRFSVESTIYLAPEHTGKGAGLRLYSILVEAILVFSFSLVDVVTTKS